MAAVKLRFCLAILAFLASARVFAGAEGGGGGEVVVCPASAAGQTYRLADFQAGERQWRLHILPANGADEFTKAQSMIGNISQYDPERAERYLKDLETFRPGTQAYKDKVNPSSDLTLFLRQNPNPQIELPANCHLEYVFLQWDPNAPHGHLEIPYSINTTLLQKLTLDERAAVYVHEMILMEARSRYKQGVDQAEFAAMYLTSYLASSRFQSDGFLGYLTTNSEAFRRSDAAGRIISSAIMRATANIKPVNQWGNESSVVVSGDLDFYASTLQPTLGKVVSDTRINVMGEPVKVASVTFDEQGYIINFDYHDLTNEPFPFQYTYTFSIQGKNVKAAISIYEMASLYSPSGKIHTICISGPVSLTKTDGTKFILRDGDEDCVELDQKGLVLGRH